MRISKYYIITAILIGLSLTHWQCIKRQQKTIAALENKIALLKETYKPIRFKVLSKTDDSIKVLVKFYDVDKKEINKFETTVPGHELSFDFNVIPVKNKFIAFPSLLFSDALAASNGMKMYKFYDNNGFPEIYNSKNIDKDFKAALTKVFSEIKNDKLDSIDNHFGNMVHDMKKFKEFVPDEVYSIVSHSKGGIEILEE